MLSRLQPDSSLENSSLAKSEHSADDGDGEANHPGRKICQICHSREFKYKCLTLTCCLQCIKNHKADSSCTGIKKVEPNDANPLALNSMSTVTIRDDMLMLEHGKKGKLPYQSRSLFLAWYQARGRKIPKASQNAKAIYQKETLSVLSLQSVAIFCQKQVKSHLAWQPHEAAMSLLDHWT